MQHLISSCHLVWRTLLYLPHDKQECSHPSQGQDTAMKRLALFLAFALFLLLPPSVGAAECQFVLGFKILRDLVGHDIVGACLESEHYNATGDSVQQTTGGLLVWRKADNWTAFTDGYHTWINGPNGLVQRLNTERFDWEVENIIAALYEATGGANWENSNNWLSEAPLGEWYGVTTDAMGRVTALNLGGNQLSGEIPAALGGLTNLTVLSLWGNQLSGEIPAALGGLTNLTVLDLSENQLSGEIPAALGGLTNLTVLSLAENQLSGEIPAALGGLTNLTELYLCWEPVER